MGKNCFALNLALPFLPHSLCLPCSLFLSSSLCSIGAQKIWVSGWTVLILCCVFFFFCSENKHACMCSQQDALLPSSPIYPVCMNTADVWHCIVGQEWRCYLSEFNTVKQKAIYKTKENGIGWGIHHGETAVGINASALSPPTPWKCFITTSSSEIPSEQEHASTFSKWWAREKERASVLGNRYGRH